MVVILDKKLREEIEKELKEAKEREDLKQEKLKTKNKIK